MIKLTKIKKAAEKAQMSPVDYLVANVSTKKIAESLIECLDAFEQVKKSNVVVVEQDVKPITLNEDDYNKLFSLIKPKQKRNRH